MGNTTNRRVGRLPLGPVAVLLLIVGLLTAAAPAAGPGVKDDGGFFTPAVARQATDKLKQLQQQYKHTVVVETFASPPPELAGKVDGNDASKAQAYKSFMEMRAMSLGADVYVYASKSPGHVDSVGRKDVNRSGLTDNGRKLMTSELLGYFRNRDFDGGLTNLTASLEKTYAAAGTGNNTAPGAWTPPANNTPTPAAPPANGRTQTKTQTAESSGGLGLGSLLCFGIVGLILLFVVISVIKRLFGGGRQNPPPLPGGQPGYGQPGYGQNYGPGGYGNQGGGGGFGRGIGGGILGGLLGSWIGGNVFGQGHQSGSGDANSGGGLFGGGSNDAGNTGGDANGFSSGGGGDFDAGSSSSDFSGGGGGDFGGGDSGGGDSGGGGDF